MKCSNESKVAEGDAKLGRAAIRIWEVAYPEKGAQRCVKMAETVFVSVKFAASQKFPAGPTLRLCASFAPSWLPMLLRPQR
jgi:hypothetical protein